ncbi:uncharacterized protein HMPREF1541_10244 [Cyphellophora europaea CBS 101466]|uniref:Transcription factor domain-containing protein n=1 Tax=Cyphellophora europaea (strain CBS 101466) TaxID=1220924 RepID=W2S9I2_CYPE1|nr:uncharacterized protein HMPREF1541_10244 [Cyphellophora europaea CBS 101466]ETN44574.1 hypothetical protein HMPREF1541_10244 [Cyphellophora europaea CBS 101466]
MAQDLSIKNYNDADLSATEASQMRNLWFACLFQDAFLSALFGQTMSITLIDSASTLADVEEALEDPESPKYFLHAVRQSLYLRLVLSDTTQLGSRRPRFGRPSTLENDYASLKCFNDIEKLEIHQSCALQMMWHHTQLLQISQGTAIKDTIGPVVPQHGLGGAVTVVNNACESLIWCTREFQRSTAAQLYVWLYCATRALMVVVDVLICRKRSTTSSTAFDIKLEKAIGSARALKDRLLEDTSWGLHWIQGHAISAILRRLDDGMSQRVVSPSVLKIANLCNEAEHDSYTKTFESEQLSSVTEDVHFDAAFSCATDWTTIFRQYDSEYNWILDEAPQQIW